MHILGFIFIIFIVILVIGLSIIGKVIRTIFGLGAKNRTNQNTTSQGSSQQQQNYTKSHSYTNENDDATITIYDTRVKPRKKIFTEDEGEYVDYDNIA